MLPFPSPWRLLAPALALAVGLSPSVASAVEFAARLGLSDPSGSRAQVGPMAGLSLSLPVYSRLALTAAADFSSHDVPGRPAQPVASATAALGVEASLDLAPIVPVFSLGPTYQYAWVPATGAKADAFGGYLAVGLRATVLEHLRLGLQARYLTASFTADSFPAYVTFAVEVGWTSE